MPHSKAPRKDARNDGAKCGVPQGDRAIDLREVGQVAKVRDAGAIEIAVVRPVARVGPVVLGRGGNRRRRRLCRRWGSVLYPRRKALNRWRVKSG
jgi:hypothetical protein